jgi:hypothetical protein
VTCAAELSGCDYSAEAEIRRAEGEGEMTDDDPNEAYEVVPIEPGPHDPPRLPVNKITWPQVGRVSEPGRYMYTFGWLTITAEDLAVWEQYPNAAFTLLRTAPAAETEDEFRLGTFELRENISLSEK